MRDEVAFTIAGVGQGDRPPLLAEMVELRLPDTFVRSHAMEEDDRNSLAAAHDGNVDHPAIRSDHPHRTIFWRVSLLCKRGARL